MDSIVFTALDEICSQGNTGIPLVSLWSRLTHPLSPSVKAHLWRNLLAIPQLQFKAKKNNVYGSSDPSIQHLEDALRLDLRIIANENLRSNFVGLYEAQSNISPIQLRVLERLAVARENGVTQNLLAKEFGIKGTNFFYVIEQLKSRGLIVKQSAIVRTKETVDDDDSKTNSCISTNMINLTRYAKPLCSSQQRIEICKEDMLVKDFLPSMQAICDKLEEAKDKVLVLSDVKQELGYSGSHSIHRAWRSVYRRLIDSHFVEEFDALVNNKVERCIRLLKKFSAKDSKETGRKKQVLKFGRSIMKKTEQILELPLDNQIYDMVDAQESKGLAVMEIPERLGIDKKKSYSRLYGICSRLKMHLQAESQKKTRVFRVWTSRHAPDKPENLSKSHDDNDTGGGLAQTSFEHNNMENSKKASTTRVLDGSKANAKRRKVRNLQEESFYEIPDKVVDDDAAMGSAPDLAKPHLITVENSLRERRILERLKKEKFVLRTELHKWLLSFEKDRSSKIDRRTIERILKRLQQEGLCRRMVFSSRNHSSVKIVLHPSVQKLTPEVVGEIRDRIKSKKRKRNEKKTIPILSDLQRRVKSKSKDSTQNENSRKRKRSREEDKNDIPIEKAEVKKKDVAKVSQKWLRRISRSPFPVNTGKRAAKFSSWFLENEREDDGVELNTSDLQCGDVLNLFSMVASGEVPVSVILPEEGVGEADEIEESDSSNNSNKKLKLLDEEGEIKIRKAKGFPGIALSVRRLILPTTPQTSGNGIEGETEESTLPVPWLKADGSINKLVYDRLVRCLLGTVMQNPGIPEDEIIKRMDVLNPESCRKLLELMILDGYMEVREIVQTKFTGPPSLLTGSRKPEVIRRKHFFANSKGVFAL